MYKEAANSSAQVNTLWPGGNGQRCRQAGQQRSRLAPADDCFFFSFEDFIAAGPLLLCVAGSAIKTGVFSVPADSNSDCIPFLRCPAGEEAPLSGFLAPRLHICKNTIPLAGKVTISGTNSAATLMWKQRKHCISALFQRPPHRIRGCSRTWLKERMIRRSSVVRIRVVATVPVVRFDPCPTAKSRSTARCVFLLGRLGNCCSGSNLSRGGFGSKFRQLAGPSQLKKTF